MGKNDNRVAVHIDDMPEFYHIRHGVDALMEEGIPVDFIVSSKHSDMHTLHGKQSLLDETYHEIVRHGYDPIREIDESIRYKVLLEPHPSEKYYLPAKLNHEFRIKYKYALISAKLKTTFSVARNIDYDAILCYTKREAEILSAYTKTFLVPPMRYKNFIKDSSRPSKKPTLLYAPTFGYVSSIDTIENALHTLKKDYYIIVKSHHMTQTREIGRIDSIRAIADEYYGQAADLAELLQKTDVMLSDNSASIFDAIYAEVPVAIFNHTDDLLNEYRIGRLDTYHSRLVEKGVIPYANNTGDIGRVLKAAVENKEKQKLEKTDFAVSEDGVSGFVDVIKYFLSQNRDDSEYYALRDVIVDARRQQVARIEELENELSAVVGSKAYKLGKALASPYRAIVKKAKKKS